jgi:RNA polymerase sigma factor (TIGR02999 family)
MTPARANHPDLRPDTIGTVPPSAVAGILAGRLLADLRRIARQHLAHEAGRDRDDPAALISEAYLRLTRERNLDEGNGAQFLALASTSMRRVLADEGRRRRALKRPQSAVPMDEIDCGVAPQIERTLPVSEAMAYLGSRHPRRAAMVRLRFYDGLSIEEIADGYGVSPATVKRDLRAAFETLRSVLRPCPARGGQPMAAA